MADLATLLAQLDAIESACQESRWEEAEALLSEYDARLRAVPSGQWQAEDLHTLLHRQAVLGRLMQQHRDSAAGELAQMGASRRGAKAYGG